MKSEKQGWFEVDKDGLAKLLRRKSMSFVLYELVQNAWDTSATQVDVELTPVPDRSLAHLHVRDNDPEGFRFLSHGYVLFAESLKKEDPTKRGRFNLGEKLVLAACETARLSSTTGTIYFERSGAHKELTRRETRERTKEGSTFDADIRLTRPELTEVLACADLLLPSIPTTINGRLLPVVEPIRVFDASLPTEVSDEDGYLKRVTRRTTVRLYPQRGGVSHLYEMGIPVVDIELPWSVEVMQKVPLSTDRDNVTPAYRRALAVAVLNEMHDDLDPSQAALPIIEEALESPDVSAGAVASVLTHQYGKQRVTWDPTDREANSNAVAHGYTVIPSRAFTKAQWSNIRRTEASTPAGRVFPTPKCYNPEGDPAKSIPEGEWTDGMKRVTMYAKALSIRLMGFPVDITMENERSQFYNANYGSRHLTFNVPRLGKKWFDLVGNIDAVNDILLHEFGHEFAANHLDEEYHRALTRLGAKFVGLALAEPGFFREHGIT